MNRSQKAWLLFGLTGPIIAVVVTLGIWFSSRDARAAEQAARREAARHHVNPLAHDEQWYRDRSARDADMGKEVKQRAGSPMPPGSPAGTCATCFRSITG
jgi:hypothetical protein